MHCSPILCPRPVDGRGNGIRKLILLGYANHADKHGGDAYPVPQTIADHAECDVRTVQRHVGWLPPATCTRVPTDHGSPSPGGTSPSSTTSRQVPTRLTSGQPAPVRPTGTGSGQGPCGLRKQAGIAQAIRGDNVSPLQIGRAAVRLAQDPAHGVGSPLVLTVARLA